MNGLITDIDLDRARNLAQLLNDCIIDEFKINNIFFSKIIGDLVEVDQVSKVNVNLKAGYCEIVTSSDMRYFGLDFLLTKFQDRFEVHHVPLERKFSEYLLLYLSTKLDDEELLNLLSMIISTEHNLVSLGQAIAVTRRIIAVPLSAQERTQLSRLRKKVDDADHLVKSFGFLIGNPHRDQRYGNITLRFICNKCSVSVELDEGIMQQPRHCGQSMGLVWSELPIMDDGSHYLDDQSRLTGVNELEQKMKTGLETTPQRSERSSHHKRLLVCNVCSEEFEIDKELNKLLIKSDAPVTLPKHHGEEMKLIIEPDNLKKNDEYLIMQKYIALIKKFENAGTDRTDPNKYKYYYCLECLELVSMDSTEVPTHHKKSMKLLTAFVQRKNNEM